MTTSVQLGAGLPGREQPACPGALAKFLGVFALTQIPLAIAEGLLGVLLFRVLTDERPAGARATRASCGPVPVPPRRRTGREQPAVMVPEPRASSHLVDSCALAVVASSLSRWCGG